MPAIRAVFSCSWTTRFRLLFVFDLNWRVVREGSCLFLYCILLTISTELSCLCVRCCRVHQGRASVVLTVRHRTATVVKLFKGNMQFGPTKLVYFTIPWGDFPVYDTLHLSYVLRAHCGVHDICLSLRIVVIHEPGDFVFVWNAQHSLAMTLCDVPARINGIS